jgi:hypothetical protein
LRRRRCGRVCRLVGKIRLGAAARPGVVSGFPEHCCQWWGWRCRGFIPRAGCRPKAERQGVEAARPRRLATGQRPRGRRVSAFEQILRGAAPRRPRQRPARPRLLHLQCALWGLRVACPCSLHRQRGERRSWACLVALIAMPFRARLPQPRATQRRCAAAKKCPKSRCLRTTTLQSVAQAADGMRGLCMRECVLVVLKKPFSSTFPAAAVVTAAAGPESSSRACTACSAL